MKNIKIMGAGLSGLSAAINLVKAGYNVDVFEKRNDCGKRFLGDLEGFENWSSKIDVMHELKEMNIKNNFFYSPFKTIVLSDGKELIKKTFENPVCYLVKRGPIDNSLDQGFKKQALDVGVNIHFNSKVKKEDMNIIASGPAENKPIGTVKGIRFESDSEDIAVALLNNEASSIYSYLLITDGHGCICSVNLNTGSEEINRYYEKTYELITKQFDIDMKNVKKVGGVGCFSLKPRLVEKGKIFTGEAAGLQDLFWGFGMRYAITSGYLAAQSIIENKNYKRLIKQRLSGRLKTSVVNRFLCERFGNRYYTYLFSSAKKYERWVDLLYKGYNPSFYSKIIYPIAKRSLAKRYKIFTTYNDE